MNEQHVPCSSGTRRPSLEAPEYACDSHMHIYDSRFSPSPHWKKCPPEAQVEGYRLFQKRIGTSRTIVVTPSTYGVDNSCTLDALSQMGPTARGVAVVDTDVSNAELERLKNSGVCGIRVNFISPQSWGVTTIEMLKTLAQRVSDFGWHVQILMSGDQIITAEETLKHLTIPIVFDHLCRLPQPQGVNHRAFRVILNLLDKGHTWVKLSGAYMDTIVGPPTYSDTTKVAQALIKAAPERMVWGSDWPHPTEKEKPDDAILFDLLKSWAPNEATIHKILVENPSLLYGF